jgi:hypothetical protein
VLRAIRIAHQMPASARAITVDDAATVAGLARRPRAPIRRPRWTIRQATLTTARREDFRIIHLSIQRTHVHLLVEAQDKGALASGMQVTKP